MKRILIIILLLLNLNLFAVDAETKNTKSSASVQTDRKVACGILLDNSGSLRQQIPQIHGSSTPITLAKETGGRVVFPRVINQT
jgi:hypothetical protein